jgi:hypothetical protein
VGLISDTKSLVRDVIDHSAARIGFGHSEGRLARDAQAYWQGEAGGARWRSYSHFRDAEVFGADVGWESVGEQHRALFERLARVVEFDGQLDRVIEWGCGGGANAVAFAPDCAKEFVGVDVTAESLRECGRQVARVSDTQFLPVLADIAKPENVLGKVGPCDLFLCLYVLELVPSPEYGMRILQIAQELLVKGGLAFVQIKYDTGTWRTGSRRRGYRGSVAASMTSYPISEFWTAAAAMGLRPEACYLVPENALDSRYAYFLLSKD